jgi:ATP-dependent Lhr-like helicase
VTRKRRGLDAILDTVETLQGAPLVASLLESEILPARIEGYEPGDLDTLLAAGEVVWAGVEPLGDKDGRLALYLTDALPRCGARRSTRARPREQAIADHLRRRARRSSGRSTTRPAAASRATPSTRCGIWSGAAS